MDVAIFALGAIGTVALTFAGIFYSSHKAPSIWIFFAGVVALLAGSCLFWQQYVSKEDGVEEKLQGFLTPANEPSPAIPCGKVPDNTVVLFLGNSAAFTDSFPHTVLRRAGENLLTIERTPQGITLNAKVFSFDGRIVAQIIKNAFYINPNNYFRSERPDRHTIAVYDQQTHMVLKVRYVNPKAILILGVFHHPGHEPVVIEEGRIILPGQGTLSQVCLGNNDQAEINID